MFLFFQSDNPRPYGFDFNVVDEYGTTLIRKEQGDELGNKQGTYGYIDASGLTRQVDYIADDKGFRAVVRTNEPGTENQNPADVQIQSDAVQPKLSPAYSTSVPVTSYARASPSSYGLIQEIGRPTRQISTAPVSASPKSYGLFRNQPITSLY